MVQDVPCVRWSGQTLPANEFLVIQDPGGGGGGNVVKRTLCKYRRKVPADGADQGADTQINV